MKRWTLAATLLAASIALATGEPAVIQTMCIVGLGLACGLWILALIDMVDRMRDRDSKAGP
ncbi:MAG: hypothetical protein HRU13_12420 [Phycisphaerales bacterium]|nr:hypothetical protein [Phycisphaerales bacterium]